MKFKNRDEIDPVASDDFLYALFYGGYIRPEKFLEPESALRVTEAMDTIRQFIDEAQEKGFIEEI